RRSRAYSATRYAGSTFVTGSQPPRSPTRNTYPRASIAARYRRQLRSPLPSRAWTAIVRTGSRVRWYTSPTIFRTARSRYESDASAVATPPTVPPVILFRTSVSGRHRKMGNCFDYQRFTVTPLATMSSHILKVKILYYV